MVGLLILATFTLCMSIALDFPLLFLIGVFLFGWAFGEWAAERDERKRQ